MCKEFRDQVADPNYEGYCHCMLYYKEKVISRQGAFQHIWSMF